MMQWLVTELFWFVAGLVLFLLELASPGSILFFFGIGAWAVAFVLFGINLSLDTQLVLFLCTSLFAFFILRGKLKGIFRGKAANVAEFGGEFYEFTGNEAIIKDSNYRLGYQAAVEFNGTLWKAEPDEPIEEGVLILPLRYNP